MRDGRTSSWSEPSPPDSRHGAGRLGPNQAGSRRVAEMPAFGPEHLIEEINCEMTLPREDDVQKSNLCENILGDAPPRLCNPFSAPCPVHVALSTQ